MNIDKDNITKDVSRLKELTLQLNAAAEAYYEKNIEIMSNLEYDRLYDELEKLEEKTRVVLANSPTHEVGYVAVNKLEKQSHPTKMLSLDKTKDVDALKSWLADQNGVLSWKLDGITVVLTYEDGRLSKAVTRGNGEVGEVITANALQFKNIPSRIPFKSELTIRGEAYINYSDFERINEELPELDAKYKNPRNLCSGSVRQLDSKVTAERNVNFTAFYISAEKLSTDTNSHIERLEWLKNQGFDVVESKLVCRDNLIETVEEFKRKIPHMDIPSDGLVLVYDDIDYGKSLGATSKFPRNAMAFKWADELAQTTLLEIKWSASRTGLINPIAVFEPVELEGTTVSRASVHNVSILKELSLDVGDRIEVYKANMIIPQISKNLTTGDTYAAPPKNCPVCKSKTKLVDDSGVEVLYCTNPECAAKKVKAFSLFVARDALNIANISEATIKAFIEKGFLREFSDIFKLKEYGEEITAMKGFGKKSFDKLVQSIEEARKTTAARLLYALGIENIGSVNANAIAEHCEEDFLRIMDITYDELIKINGVGEILAKAVIKYFSDKYKREEVGRLLGELEISVSKEAGVESLKLKGLSIAITGSLRTFANRGELGELIRLNGGKPVSTVGSRTDILINNDKNSPSAKNKKAKQLGIPIITEDEFLERLGQEDVEIIAYR